MQCKTKASEFDPARGQRFHRKCGESVLRTPERAIEQFGHFFLKRLQRNDCLPAEDAIRLVNGSRSAWSRALPIMAGGTPRRGAELAQGLLSFGASAIKPPSVEAFDRVHTN